MFGLLEDLVLIVQTICVWVIMYNQALLMPMESINNYLLGSY